MLTIDEGGVTLELDDAVAKQKHIKPYVALETVGFSPLKPGKGVIHILATESPKARADLTQADFSVKVGIMRSDDSAALLGATYFMAMDADRIFELFEDANSTFMFQQAIGARGANHQQADAFLKALDLLFTSASSG